MNFRVLGFQGLGGVATCLPVVTLHTAKGVLKASPSQSSC